MAGSVNKVILVGNLGADPEVRYTSNGQPVAHFSIATTETWNAKTGEKNERTEWHRVIAWGKLGKVCGDYLRKGRQVFVDGRIQYRSWEGKDGQKRYTTEIVANQVVFLGGPGAGAGAASADPDAAAAPGPDAGQSGPPPDSVPPADDEDLPF